MKQVATVLNDEEFARLSVILDRRKQTPYAFVKDAVLKELQIVENEAPNAMSAVIQEMIEALSQRKRYLYQLGAYADDNQRHWLAGRFPQATKREVIEAVARWRAAGGKT